jgi:hypothetical protein
MYIMTDVGLELRYLRVPSWFKRTVNHSVRRVDGELVFNSEYPLREGSFGYVDTLIGDSRSWSPDMLSDRLISCANFNVVVLWERQKDYVAAYSRKTNRG